jgi:hypothetical protein
LALIQYGCALREEENWMQTVQREDHVKTSRKDGHLRGKRPQDQHGRYSKTLSEQERERERERGARTVKK